jgi:hypothetical protein
MRFLFLKKRVCASARQRNNAGDALKEAPSEATFGWCAIGLAATYRSVCIECSANVDEMHSENSSFQPRTKTNKMLSLGNSRQSAMHCFAASVASTRKTTCSLVPVMRSRKRQACVDERVEDSFVLYER